jgi:WD40 repeat protein
VTASLDGHLHVFDSSSGAQLATLSGHGGGVYAVAFGPHGERLVSASFDKTLLVWDVSSNEALLALRGHVGPLTDVAFDPAGHRIVSGSFDGTVAVWETTGSSERYRAKRAAALVERELARLGSLNEVVESIRADRNLDPELAEEALALAALRD